ncbi:Rpn family recombination-promoting nuclease/putative transposase [Leyella stercorea]|uniref:Rpn family recombination-promoting nuclease/putative transposase n=1 Tax=Leyella stercorea TaxID=363265 RepID=UPI00242C4ADC|nr:Rpn family recombination-promoting nuclease/putative transposase [Leyella stercorea]
MGGLKDRYIRFDWAIKRLLRQKANFDVLEGFLTVFIGEEVKIVEILESEGNQQTPDDKFNRVDIKARNSKGEIILVEVQNTSELYYLERILYGVAKAITEHIHLGDTYKEVKKVYSISILYFDIGKGADYLYVGQNKFIGVHTNDQLVITAKEKGAFVQKSPAEIFPEYILVRVNEFDKVAVTPLEEWVAYLKSGVIKENTTAPGLQEARKKLQYYSMTDAERYAYDEHLNAVMIQNDVLGNAREEGLAEGRAEGLTQGRAEGLTQGRAEGLTQGRAEGLTQGRAEGRAEAKKDIVKSMLSNGLSVEQAAKYSGLTVEEVESIK